MGLVRGSASRGRTCVWTLVAEIGFLRGPHTPRARPDPVEVTVDMSNGDGECTPRRGRGVRSLRAICYLVPHDAFDVGGFGRA